MHMMFLWIILVGLIIYLVMVEYDKKGRDIIKIFDKRCPQCNNRIESDYKYCPICNEKLKTECKKCGKIVETSWKCCPFCGEYIEK